MFNFLLILSLAVYAGLLHWIIKRKLQGRIGALERDLECISDAVNQLGETQIKAREKASADFEDLEERIMNLSIPSHDSSLPLERRHQVLALARQGVAVDDIVKRLKAPVGEAELILNLSKYAGGEGARSAKRNGQAESHARM